MEGAQPTTCEIYVPETNVFVASAELSEAREDHACVQLSDGQLLIAGKA